MTEMKKALRSKQDGNKHAHQVASITSRRWANRLWALGLLCVGLIFGASPQAQADPPTANRILFNCTFTTDAGEGFINLQDALDIPDLALLNGGQLQASYIIIYVRENPNDGQLIGTPPPSSSSTYTGPIICTNADTDDITKTTEGTLIPPDPDNDPSIDILGAEEASHLQYRTTGGTMADTEKRVCHTVASNTDCFLIQPKP
jgi:hypothetical protein